MIHLKRILWLAAWSVWLWLGFGLAHHLPKWPGELVCRWKPGLDEMVLGFLNGQKEFVTLDSPATMGPSVVNVLDAATGRVIRKFDGPLTYSRYINYHRAAGFPYLITSQQHRPEFPIKLNPDYLAVLDLRSGEWSEIPVPSDDGGTMHEHRPWCLCSLGNKISVVDLETKQIVYRWKPARGAFLFVESNEPFFLGGDRLGVPIVRWSKSATGSSVKTAALEIWSLREPERPPQVFEEIEAGYSARVRGSRIVWSKASPGNVRRIEVFDLEHGRVIYPKKQTPAPGMVKHSVPALSRDGRKLLDARFDHATSRLLEIDSDRMLWTADWNERAWGGDESGRWFNTREDWSFNFFGWQKELFTWTQRSLDDGSLRFRSWENVPYLSDGDDNLYFAEDGIRRLPFQTNYPLLALCQTILALPLVLLWVALRWRRRRAAPRRPAVALP